MATPTPQRAYRAACPNCGAPVEFRSAASAIAVCSFCRSTVVRDGDDAAHASARAPSCSTTTRRCSSAPPARYQGAAFTLVGRLQYRYADGTWNEWHALFDERPERRSRLAVARTTAATSFAFDAPLRRRAPPAERAARRARRSRSTASAGRSPRSRAPADRRRRASCRAARRSSAELRRRRPAQRRAARSARSTTATRRAPAWSVGRSVRARRPGADRACARAARRRSPAAASQCPNCGAALEVKLATTQSIVCHQCKAVVDVSQRRRRRPRALRAGQRHRREPQIPLGSVGTLALGGERPLPWQVVGYVERCEVPEDDEDEQTFWREYLLYHRSGASPSSSTPRTAGAGPRPITGAPAARRRQRQARRACSTASSTATPAR